MRKFSVYSGVCTKIPFEARIAAIKAAGFDEVCLDFEEEMVVTETPWENQVKIAQKYGLPVENAHLTWRNINALWEAGDLGDKIQARVIDELTRTKALGIGTGIVHITAGMEAPKTDFEIGLRRFDGIAEAAEKIGVRVAFENSVFPEHVHRVLDRIGSGYVGFCFDSGHENAFTPGEDYLKEYATRVMALHLHDNDGKSDAHALPFSGTIDWKKKIGELRRSEYFKEHLTLECSFEECPSFEEGLIQALATAHKLTF